MATAIQVDKRKRKNVNLKGNVIVFNGNLVDVSRFQKWSQYAAKIANLCHRSCYRIGLSERATNWTIVKITFQQKMMITVQNHNWKRTKVWTTQAFLKQGSISGVFECIGDFAPNISAVDSLCKGNIRWCHI